MPENSYYDDEKERWDFKSIADHIDQDNEFLCVESGDSRTLYYYERGVWKPNGETVVESKALNMTNELLRPNNINQVIRVVKNRNRIDKENFQMKDYIIPFENGVYDLEEGEFNDHAPGYNLTYKHPVKYLDGMSDATLKSFKDFHVPTSESGEDLDVSDARDKEHKSKAEEFINSLVDTERKQSILKETVGLALMSNYPIQEAPILYGKGSNGKNMYVKMLKEMSGKWHSLDLGEFTDDQFAKAELQGSSFVFFDELGHINDPNKLKSFIGEEDMRVREMQTLGYMGKQRAIPIMAGNEIPSPPEQTDGFFRRFCIIDFPYTFTDKEDDHKDKKPKREIEEKHFNLYELSKLATQVVNDLENVLEDESYTQSYNIQQKRQVWNMKSSMVYTFLDMFVEQGERPDQSSLGSADAIIKDDLLEMCNQFINQLNGTKIRKHTLTQALRSNPDLDLSTDVRKEDEDGKQRRAYSGVKLVLPRFHQTQGLSDLETAGNILLLNFSNKFDVASVSQYAQTLEMVETDVEAKTLRYIRETDTSSLSLLRLARALDLTEGDVNKIYNSRFLNVDGKIVEGFGSPEISIDSEAFDQAVKESDIVVKDEHQLKRPKDWLNDQVSSWSKETVKDREDILDKADDKGFGRETVDDMFNQLMDEAEVYEPQPGKVQRL